jgi:hypothetical protein
MPDHQELKEQARAKTRSLLSHSQSFRTMEREEQMALYKDLVDAHYNDLAEQQGLATEFAAGDMIDPNRHINRRIGDANQDAADIMGKLVSKVNFPGFVRDLLVGVFDANQDANERQMVAFMELMKQATKSLADYVREVGDEEALLRLVQSDNKYRLAMTKTGAGRRRSGARRGGAAAGQGGTQGGSNSSGTESSKPVLIDQNGKEVNMNDATIQAKILDARLAMAKERRTLLRETLLMGVSRMVVEKGVIRANVKFRIDAYEDTVNDDQAEENRSGGSSFHAGLFGLGGGFSRQKTQVSIATSNTEMGSEMSAEMEGFVEIQFKSDYFKLDNFREIFDLGQGQVPPGQAQVPQGTTPQQQLPPQAVPVESPPTPQ